jgi:signal transduction histidine kinase
VQTLLSDLLSVIGHDLRNPLGVVMMGTAALSRAATDPERVRRSAETIGRAGERMNRIIDDVVDYAQLTSNGLSLDLLPCSAAGLVAELVEHQLPLANKKKLDLTVEVDGDLMVSCDRPRALRMLGHLLANAINFTPSGGRVSISMKPQDGEALFEVRDNGPGLGAERLANPFERRRGGRKQPGEGVGLGLPIVRGLVEAHGGRVWIESPPQGGTVVRFTMRTASV